MGMTEVIATYIIIVEVENPRDLNQIADAANEYVQSIGGGLGFPDEIEVVEDE